MSKSDAKQLFEKFPIVAVADLPLKDLKVNKMLSEESLEMREEDFVRLTDSVKRHGVLVPIMVTKDGYVVDGFHRRMGAKEAGRETIKCVVLEPKFEDHTVQEWLDYSALVNMVRRNSSEEYIRLVIKKYPLFFASQKEMSSKKPTKELSVRKIAEADKVAKITVQRAIKKIRKESTGVEPMVFKLELPNKQTKSKKQEDVFINCLNGFRGCHKIIAEDIDGFLDAIHDVTATGNPMQYVKVAVMVEMLPKEKK